MSGKKYLISNLIICFRFPRASVLQLYRRYYIGEFYLHKFVLHSFAIGVSHTFEGGGWVPSESLSVKLPPKRSNATSVNILQTL